MKFHISLFTILFGLVTSIFSQDLFPVKIRGKNLYHVPKVTSSIIPDGILDEEVWKKALILELKFEVEPGENIPPPVQTHVLLAYNKTHLFIAFRAYDPNPEKIRAHISEREKFYYQDWVGVILDTFNDERRSFNLFCNPLGIQSDNIDTQTTTLEWDAIWDSGGKINKQGYFVEMSVPFSSLRFQRKEDNQVWGFDAIRSYPRSLRHHIGTFPRDRNKNCYLCQSIKIIGFQDVKPGKNLEIDPTLVGYVSKTREDENESPFFQNRQLEPGITTRWGFTPNLTLSATANPDFSQVEADALQLDINEPFALYYPEKRPFFTEGIDFFDLQINTVYTRTIRDPSWGLKLTGKEGHHTIGAYIVHDTLTNLIFPDTQSSQTTSLPAHSTATVLRYRRDLGNKYTFGALFTNRSGKDYYNRVLSFDMDLRITSKDCLQFQIIGSSSRYPKEVAKEFAQPMEQFNDKAFEIMYFHNTRNLNWSAGYRDIGKAFRADLGFIPKTGYRSIYAGANYRWLAKPNQWWSEFILEGDYSQEIDFQGLLLNRDISLSLTYRGPMEMDSILQYTHKRESYNGIFFNQNQFQLSHFIKPHEQIHSYIFFIFGDRIDYNNIRLGKRLHIRPTLSYNIGLHTQLILSHTFEKMWVNSQRLYTASQSEIHIAYQFNKQMTLKGIFQYIDYRYNTLMYIHELNPTYRQLFTQILFSYKMNPQTVLFLGYTDKYVGFDHTSLPLSDRKLFLKVGYALVL